MFITLHLFNAWVVDTFWTTWICWQDSSLLSPYPNPQQKILWAWCWVAIFARQKYRCFKHWTIKSCDHSLSTVSHFPEDAAVERKLSAIDLERCHRLRNRQNLTWKLKLVVLLVVAPWTLADVCRCFTGACCFLYQGDECYTAELLPTVTSKLGTQGFRLLLRALAHWDVFW